MEIRTPLLKMRRVQQAGIVAALIVALTLLAHRTAHAIAASLVLVSNTLSNPAVTLPQHKAASQLVQLQGPSGFAIESKTTSTALAQYNPATSDTAATPFVVPAGQSLVVTDVDIDFYIVGENVGVLFSNGNITTITSFGQYYERFDFYPTSSNQQEHLSFQSGLVFPAGSTVGVTLTNSEATVVVRGYLTPE